METLCIFSIVFLLFFSVFMHQAWKGKDEEIKIKREIEERDYEESYRKWRKAFDKRKEQFAAANGGRRRTTDYGR